MVEDEGLIRAHRAGDRDAFPALVERYRDRIYRLCYRLTLDKEDALDLCQLTFWKAYRGLAEYDRQGALFTWLYRIASNAAIDLLRDRRRRAQGLARVERRRSAAERFRGGRDEPARPAGAAGERAEDDPARLALRKELHGEVARAVNALSPEHRATLMLRAAEGLSYREIASALDCPVGTVMSRLHVARERVREALAGYLHGYD
jgi:RNA polymerase sigma-70 factor (ECF subfamily)